MGIFDMFVESKDSLDRKNFRLNQLDNDVRSARYLLCRQALGKPSLRSSFSIATKAYPAYGLLYVASGSLQYTPQTTPEDSVSLGAGSLLLWDCRVPYTLSVRSAADLELLYFDGYCAAFYCDQLLDKASYFETASTAELHSKFQLLFSEQLKEPMLYHMFLTELLTRLVLLTSPAQVHIPGYLTQIKELFDTRYYEEHPLAELEAAYHVNKYRICKDFKTHYHTSPIQYLHQVRIQTAQALLRESNMTIHEIAYEVGYENVNHFIHHFKKAADVTPAAYRKHLK